uniref:Uncharacterized protein n=1 Tax=Arundo donax TaxID=35708 RepID=A0A0A9C6Q4_ARUDO
MLPPLTAPTYRAYTCRCPSAIVSHLGQPRGKRTGETRRQAAASSTRSSLTPLWG